MADESQVGTAGLGRRILIGLGGFGVLLGGFLGFIVGANSENGAADISVGGVFAVPLTPGAMALYGMAVVAVALISLYGALSLATMFDSNAQ